MIQPIPCMLFEVVAGFIILSRDIQKTTWNSYEFSPQPNPIESLNTPDIQYLWWGGIRAGCRPWRVWAKGEGEKNSNVIYSQPRKSCLALFQPHKSPCWIVLFHSSHSCIICVPAIRHAYMIIWHRYMFLVTGPHTCNWVKVYIIKEEFSLDYHRVRWHQLGKRKLNRTVAILYSILTAKFITKQTSG